MLYPRHDPNSVHNEPSARPDGPNSEPPSKSKASWWDGILGASHKINQAASDVAGRLGRPSNGGEALDAAHHPEDYGATDDIQMTDLLQRDHELTNDAYQSKLQTELGSRAQLLMGVLGLGSHTSIHSQETDHGTLGGGILSHLLKKHKHHRRQVSDGAISAISTESRSSSVKGKKPRREKWYESEEGRKARKRNRHAQLTQAIATIITRERYIIKLCRALMKYGAPTHRLEEYMHTTAKELSVQGHFLYLPGCMIMSFHDPITCTTDIKIVREEQGLDLGRLADTHNVYKGVVHDKLGAEKATEELETMLRSPPRYHQLWLRCVLVGLFSVTVSPWAFDGRPVDMPIIFVLGCLMGVMQFWLSPRSKLYANVFEVSAAVVLTFIARGFGSIRVGGHSVFCFSAIVQSSIALILPGYTVLCSSLELQSHQIVAGSIRLVYTYIYSLFLGYGVTVGITVYGLMDNHAATEPTCSAASLKIYGNEYIQHFAFVPIYCAFAALVNQAKWKQLPTTSILGTCGYVTNHLATKYLDSRLGSTIGAFTIGLLANLYSRVWHGHAAVVIVPGIFTQVSSGLAASGSIVSGLAYAKAVKHNAAAIDVISQESLQETLSGLGYTMVQTALSITVGLFLSALVVYPRGKKHSALFSL